MMKKILPLIALAGCISLAQAENIVLDLSQPTTPIEYNDNDVWSGVYTDGDITSHPPSHKKMNRHHHRPCRRARTSYVIGTSTNDMVKTMCTLCPKQL